MTQKINILTFLIFFPLFVIGQNENDILCKTDTVEMILAYEYNGQCCLDDMIFKLTELVEYQGKEINSKNYKLGVYHFFTPLRSKTVEKLNECGLNINIDSVIRFNDPFLDVDTKVITYRNKSFRGKGTTQLGNPIKWKYHDFEYKLFKVKFVKVFIGIESRTIVNIDRKSKNENQTITIDCPIYVMIDIINITKIE